MSKFINTGNSIVDSILNFKIKESEKEEIKIITNIQIPADMEMKEIDLTTILLNLLDNAISAAKEMPKDGKKIFLKMVYHCNLLTIELVNGYSGELRKDKLGRVMTTNKEKEGHGIGLNNVLTAAERYKGSLNIQINEKEKIFSVFVMLYLLSDK